MKIMNVSLLPVEVKLNNILTTLMPANFIEINPFDLGKLSQISQFVRNGLFAIIDEDEDFNEFPKGCSSLISNKTNSIFQNVNFDDDIGDF